MKWFNQLTPIQRRAICLTAIVMRNQSGSSLQPASSYVQLSYGENEIPKTWADSDTGLRPYLALAYLELKDIA